MESRGRDGKTARQNTSTPREIVAYGVRGIAVRRDEAWDTSVSVPGCRLSEKDGVIQLQVDIQSGDSLDIETARIDLPGEAWSLGHNDIESNEPAA